MAKNKVVVEKVLPRETDNTSRIALGISVIALLVALFALLGEKNDDTRVGGLDAGNNTVEDRIDNLEARSALTKAQAELLILTQRIGQDPTVNVQAEIDEIKADLEEFSNNPEREVKESWKELVNELDELSKSANNEGIVQRINLFILRIQQEIKDEGRR